MKFNSKAQLSQHVKELEKSGYLTSSWMTEHIEEDGKPKTRHTKIFKINFSNVKIEKRMLNED